MAVEGKLRTISRVLQQGANGEEAGKHHWACWVTRSVGLSFVSSISCWSWIEGIRLVVEGVINADWKKRPWHLGCTKPPIDGRLGHRRASSLCWGTLLSHLRAYRTDTRGHYDPQNTNTVERSTGCTFTSIPVELSPAWPTHGR
jgi:hypothetical protein